MAYYRISIREFRANPDRHWNIKKLCRQPLSPKFIREFADKLDWDEISEKQNMTEDFIKEFKDKINWKKLCNYRAKTKLSEQFIYKMREYVDWRQVSYYVNFSKQFMYKHLEWLDINQLFLNYRLTEPVRNDLDFINFVLRSKVNDDPEDYNHIWDYMQINVSKNFDFIREYKDRITFSNLLGQIRNKETLQKFVDEFHPYFNDEELWDRLEYQLGFCDFDFIMKYNDHFKHTQYRHPLNSNYYRKRTDKFTVEQEIIIGRLWKT